MDEVETWDYQHKQWSDEDDEYEYNEPRYFHSHFCNCFGACDLIGWASYCLACLFPGIAFGMNVFKTTGKIGRAIFFGLLLLLLLTALESGIYGIFWMMGNHQGLTEDPDSKCPVEKCNKYMFLLSIALTVISLAIAILGCTNRRSTRVALEMDIDDTCSECCDDFWAWYCCQLGLSQETRTLLYNRVQNGHWRGPEDMKSSIP